MSIRVVRPRPSETDVTAADHYGTPDPTTSALPARSRTGHRCMIEGWGEVMVVDRESRETDPA